MCMVWCVCCAINVCVVMCCVVSVFDIWCVYMCNVMCLCMSSGGVGRCGMCV